MSVIERSPRYSSRSLLRARFAGRGYWKPLWGGATLKDAYDVVVVGAGGHGLATAYHLARDHGIRRIAVLEKHLVGYGNVGRNTTIVRSNYLLPQNHYFYEDCLRRWETLSRDLNYNVMFSPRGVIDLATSDADMVAFARRGNAMRLAGIDAELLDRDALARFVPELRLDVQRRFPIVGGFLQRRAGTVRHDAVVVQGAVALFPQIAGLRILRQWAGTNDMSMDGSPIMDRLAYDNVFVNGGWCYGGFKAIPGSGAAFARFVATGAAPDLIRAYRLPPVAFCDRLRAR